MSKADGDYLGICFTEALRGDVTGLENQPIGSYVYQNLTGMGITASALYSGYTTAPLTDGQTNAYTRFTSTVPQTIDFAFSESIALYGFRWYIGSSSYYPVVFSFEASPDGETYETLGTFTGTSTIGWQEFVVENEDDYPYYRITITQLASSRLYLYEIQFRCAVGNEGAFTVSGQEYNYEPGGTLTNMTYAVASVTAYPADDHAILLKMHPLQRFARVEGALTVSYDADIGSLAGMGGPVASFATAFLPEDLVGKPHPHDPEHIELTAVSADANLLHIYYTDVGSGTENVQISGITAVGTLTHIDDL